MRVLIIIPAYNEALSIEEVVRASRAVGYPVLVVDDGSSDATAAKAQAAGAEVIRHAFNLGVVAALQTGYLYAIEHSYDAVVQLDGDGQHDPADVPALLAPLLDGSADFVLGSRFLGVGEYRMPLSRRIGRDMLRAILRGFAVAVTDPTSGLQAMRREVSEVFVSPEFPEDYPDADALLLAVRRGFRLREVGVSMRQSLSGKTIHNGFLHPLKYMLCMILSLSVVMLREKVR